MIGYPQIGQTAHTLLTSAETWGSDGRPVRSYSSAGAIVGSLQTAPAKDVERLPEGVRTKDVRVLYSRGAVPTPIQQAVTPEAPARVLTSNGVTYDIVKVEVYDQPGPVLTHWAAYLVRVPEHESASSP